MKNEAKITVNVGLEVSKENAESALKIVEWYCNDNGVLPISDKSECGIYEFSFQQNITEDYSRGKRDNK